MIKNSLKNSTGENNNDAVIIANVGNNIITAGPIAAAQLTVDPNQGNNNTAFDVGGI